jgi:hypothetical protein
LPDEVEEEEEDDANYDEDYQNMVGQLADDSLALIKDSQTMDEATVNILDDPMALSFVLKKQYEDVLNKNAKLRHTEKNGINQVRNLELEA